MRIGLFLTLVFVALLFAGCGGGGEEASPPPATTAAPAAAAPAATAAGGTTVGSGQAETIKDKPLTLNLDQPLPPDFKTAYQQRSLITVQFDKTNQQDPFYPQGLVADRKMSSSIESLRSQYPTIKFFSYDIDDPGTATEGTKLQAGQYGTLAAQLGVGLTPFFATLAPASNGGGYLIKNLFQGYVPRPVINQALFDLSAVQVENDTSDMNVTLEQLDLTQSGGGIEYITVKNHSPNQINLQGFSLRTLDPKTGDVNPDSKTVLVKDEVIVQPGETVSVGRAPDVVDADGKKVAGTFQGGDGLGLAPGDQIALLDPGGAVADTIVV